MTERLTEALGAEAERLADAVRQQGQNALLDELVWQAQKGRLLAAVAPILERLAAFGAESVQRSLGDSSVGINWNLANQNATNWAQQHAGDLITRVTDTTRRRVGAKVAEWAESAEGLPDLVQRIQSMKDDNGALIFSPQRAEMIAVTEATSAYATANSQAWAAAGYGMAVYKPPSHPNCRCFLQVARLKDSTKVMVWNTAKDEIVCTQTLNTPWGAVDGCKNLHQVVVSQGPWMGKRIKDL